MLENIDFVFVPTECWNFLAKKYGTGNDYTPIQRKVETLLSSYLAIILKLLFTKYEANKHNLCIKYAALISAHE